MWEHQLLPLLIWMTIAMNGDAFRPSMVSMEMNPNPSIALVDMETPTIMLPMLQRDQQDRVFHVDPSPSDPDIELIGWAGPGNTANKLSPQSPPAIPKWTPDFKPVKEKYWDAIVEALDKTNGHSFSLAEAGHSSLTNPSSILMPLTSSLQVIPNSQQTSESRNDYITVQPNSPLVSNYQTASGSGSLLQDNFNPFKVYLPDHVRRNDNNQHANSNFQYINSNPSHKNNDKRDGPKEVKYISWPNTGQDDGPAVKLNTAYNNVQNVFSTFLGNRRKIQSHGQGIPTTASLQREHSETPKMKPWPDVRKQSSSQAITPPVNRFQVHGPNNPPKTLQWKLLTKENSPKLSTSGHSSNRPKFSPPNPIQAHNPHSVRKNVNPSHHTPPISSTSLSKLAPIPKINQREHILKNKTDNTSNSPSLSNQKQKNVTKPVTTTNSQFNASADKIYQEPWLHAAVQHDLKEWGYPYDRSALPNPFKEQDKSHNPSIHSRSPSGASFQVFQGNDFTNMKKVPTQREQHLAVVEVPTGPDVGPVPIKNVHVIAPKPNDMPPVPPFRPAEKKRLESPPYFLREASPNQSSLEDSDSLLLIQPPSPSLKFEAPDIYPVAVPLTAAVERQGSTPLQNLMRPLRNMFQFGRDTQSSHPQRPHKNNPPRLLPPRPNHPARQAPKEIPRPPIRLRPDFGPPKGEDIVAVIEELQQQNDTDFINKTLPQGISDIGVGENIIITPQPLIQHNPHQSSFQNPQQPRQEHQGQQSANVHQGQQSFNEHQGQQSSNEHQGQQSFNEHQGQQSFNEHQGQQPFNEHQGQNSFNEHQGQHSFNEHQGHQSFNRVTATPINNISPHQGTQEVREQPEVTFTLQENISPHQNIHEFREQPDLQQQQLEVFTHAPPKFEPPPNTNIVSPQVSSTFQPKPPTFTKPPRPTPPTPSFIPWPDTRGTKFPSSQTTLTTARPSFTFFDQTPNLPTFRLPSIRNMEFLNPFNMFRNRESGHTNSGFSWFPSILSNTNNANNLAQHQGQQSGVPNFRPPPEKQPNPQSLSQNKNTRFLRNVPGSSGNNGNGNGFTLMPHLPTIFQNKKRKTPPTLSSHEKPPPLLRSTSEIHKITQPKHTRSHYGQQTSTEKYLEETIFIVSPNNTAASGTQGGQIVNPQTNPARLPSQQFTEEQEDLGPELIKFTIEDVMPSHKRHNSINHPTNLPILTIKPSTTRPNPSINHPTNLPLLATKTTTKPNKHDMNVASSEENVRVTHFVTPVSQSNTFITTSPRTTPIPRNKIPSKVTTKISLPTTTKSKNINGNRATNPSQISSSHQFKPKFHLPITSMSKFVTKSTRSTTTTTSTPSPFTFAPITAKLKPPGKPSSKNDGTYPFSNLNWRYTKPQINSQKDNSQARSKTQDFLSAASSRITIIEATPMPKAGEVFPTVKNFKSSSLASPTQKTTIKLQPPVNPTISKKNTMPTMITTSRGHMPSTQQKGYIKKQDVVLMPGNSNHRSMISLPKIESDPTIRRENQNLNNEQQNNKMKIRYSSPPRKVLHAHRASSKPVIVSEATPITSTHENAGQTKQNLHSKNPSSSTDENSNSESQGNHDATLEKEENEKLQSEISSNSTINSTQRPLLAGRPSRYNSLQRLRDAMARKRKNSGISSTTTSTPSVTTIQTNRPMLISTYKPPITTPRMMHTTQKSFALTRSQNQRTRPSSPPSTPKPYISYRAHNPRMTTPTPLTRPPKPAITIATMSPWVRQLTRPTTTPPKTPDSSTPKQKSNFKDPNYEPSGSDSSFSYEFRPPVQDVNLQEHPEMLDLYNWESTKIDETQEHLDTSLPVQHTPAESVSSDISPSNTFTSPKVLYQHQRSPLQKRDVSASLSKPATNNSRQSSLASPMSEVQGDATS